MKSRLKLVLGSLVVSAMTPAARAAIYWNTTTTGTWATTGNWWITLAFAATISLAQAATYNWNTTDGDWDAVTANWSGAGSTWGNGNDAVFLNNTTASPYLINLPGTIEATSVSFGSSLAAAAKDHSYSLSGGALDVSGALVVQGKSNNGATYANNTTVTINSTVDVTGDTRIGRANLTISGGSYTTNRITANPAGVDWANLTISGAGTVVTATNGIDGSYGTTGSNGSTATFAVNLNGGTLYTPYFKVADREGSGTAWLTFNGTTVKATANTANFITLYGGNQNAYISNNGAIIDTFDGTTAHDITIGVNLKNTSGQTGYLTKQGAGTLTLSGTNTFTGTTTISGGTLKVSGGSLASPTLNVSSFTFSQTAGTTNFTSGVSTSTSADNALVSVTGGSFSASTLSLGRTYAYSIAPTLASPIAAATSSGLYVNGAAATVSLGSLNIGTGNSSASARIDNGSVTVSGAVTIGKYSSASTRHSILQVNGGTFAAADTTAGIVLAPNGGTNDKSGAAELYLTGGTSTVGRIGFGAADDTLGGSGFVILGGGNLYVGSGGIVKATPQAAYTYTIGLNSGTLGAADNWSSSLNMTLGTNPTIKAANASDTAKNITLGGVLSGTGFTKSGGGILTLEGANNYTGPTQIAAGTLLVNNPSGSGTGSGAVTVAAGATNETAVRLGGSGTISGATGFAADPNLTGTDVGGIHSPGDPLANGGVGKQSFTAASDSVTYNTGSIFEWNLAAAPLDNTSIDGFGGGVRGTAYDAVNATALGATTGAIFRVVLNGSQNFTESFWNTNRAWSDIFKTSDVGTALNIGSIFSGGVIQYYNGGGGTLASISNPTAEGSFTISGTSLNWTAVPEPTTALAGLLLTAGLLRRRRMA